MTKVSNSHGYQITIVHGRSTEERVEAGNYGYAHTQVATENFPGAAIRREPDEGGCSPFI